MPGRQGRLVLAYLICARPRTVSRDELADLLWPDQVPDSWAASLSAVISKLRRLLGTVGLDASTVLVTSAAGVQLDLPKDVWVDYEFAHHAVETAEAALREGDHARVLAVAFDARDITSRGFLADPCEWVDRQRVVVEDLCVRAAVAEGEAHLLAGATARAVECGRDAVARAPGREA